MRILLLAVPLAAAFAVPGHAQSLVPPENRMPPAAGENLSIPSRIDYSNAGSTHRHEPVRAADLRKNAAIFNLRGYRLGRIETIEQDSVVVRHSGGVARVPITMLQHFGYGVAMPAEKFAEIARNEPL